MGKICKGTSKAKNFGCGEQLPFSERNGLKTYKAKYGLGLDCGCFNNWQKTNKPKRINQKSKKRIDQEKIYTQLRKAFLNKKENKICPITKKPTTDIHHKKGRIGDLLLDTKYWVALSREGHKKVEENPLWAKENGYSLSRLAND